MSAFSTSLSVRMNLQSSKEREHRPSDERTPRRLTRRGNSILSVDASLLFRNGVETLGKGCLSVLVKVFGGVFEFRKILDPEFALPP